MATWPSAVLPSRKAPGLAVVEEAEGVMAAAQRLAPMAAAVLLLVQPRC